MTTETPRPRPPLSPLISNTGHRETPPGDTLPALLDFITATGLPVIGCYPSGAAIGSGADYGDPTAGTYGPAWTTNPETVRALWNGQGDAAGRGKGQEIRRFRCIPGAAGFVVLDIDRGHADGADGAQELAAFITREGILLPPAAGFGVVHTRTPSGGKHYWHRYNGPRLKKQTLCPAVEVFHYHALTVPGSWKDGKPYTLYGQDGPAADVAGTLRAATALPPVIARYLKDENDTLTAAPRHPVQTRETDYQGPPAWEKIAAWVDQDGDGGAGRNAYAFAFARRARRYYTETETAAYLASCPAVAGLNSREIQTAVQSAYRKGRT